jgi:hypothetical protein
MPVQAQCPSCARVYNLADHLGGKQIRCKDCNAVIRVPEVKGTAGTNVTAENAPSKSGNKAISPLAKEEERERRTGRPPQDEAAEDRPPAKGRKADDSRPSSGKKASGKRKKGSGSPSVPKEVRNSMALLILVGFIQIVGIILIRNAASEVNLTRQGQTLLTVATAIAGGMACAALAAAFLLRAGKRLGRLLTFLVAILSLLLAILLAVAGQWGAFALWLGIGVSIIQFADSKGVRKYLKRKNRPTQEDDEDEENPGNPPDAEEDQNEGDDEEDSRARPKRKK